MRQKTKKGAQVSRAALIPPTRLLRFVLHWVPRYFLPLSRGWVVVMNYLETTVSDVPFSFRENANQGEMIRFTTVPRTRAKHILTPCEVAVLQN